MKLSELVIQSFIQKFAETEQFCGFTLPIVFGNGSPAVIHAQKYHIDSIILNDNGINIENMINTIGYVDFDAEKKVKEFLKPYPHLQYVDGSIISNTTPKDIMFSLMDYVDVLKLMVDYKYTSRENHINSILDSIYLKLESEYANIVLNPEIVGRSGSKHKFNFGHDNSLIDFAMAKNDKTGQLLRKYIDAQNSNNDLTFTVIIDDLESDKYKSEQSILSDFATVKQLSKYIDTSVLIH